MRELESEAPKILGLSGLRRLLFRVCLFLNKQTRNNAQGCTPSWWSTGSQAGRANCTTARALPPRANPLARRKPGRKRRRSARVRPARGTGRKCHPRSIDVAHDQFFFYAWDPKGPRPLRTLLGAGSVRGLGCELSSWFGEAPDYLFTP